MTRFFRRLEDRLQGVHQKALGVDENTPLSALGFLACIMAMGIDRARLFCALFALRLLMMAAAGEASRLARSPQKTSSA